VPGAREKPVAGPLDFLDGVYFFPLAQTVLGLGGRRSGGLGNATGLVPYAPGVIVDEGISGSPLDKMWRKLVRTF